MKVETENLVKISTYAVRIGKSRTWVDTLIKSGEIKLVVIDGVKFVEV